MKNVQMQRIQQKMIISNRNIHITEVKLRTQNIEYEKCLNLSV